MGDLLNIWKKEKTIHDLFHSYRAKKKKEKLTKANSRIRDYPRRHLR